MRGLTCLGIACTGAVLNLALPAESRAGCGDAMVMRVDSQRAKFADDGEPLSVELHGAVGWEASPDSWSTHPIGGALLGYVHLGCPGADRVCSGELKRFSALVGTDQPLTFSGQFVKDQPPEGIHAEGASSVATLPPWPNSPSTGGTPLNRELWPTVQRLSPPPPPRGCSVSGGAGFATLALALALLLRRVRRT
jgi:hypothetical protein